MRLGGNLALSVPLMFVLQLTPAQRVGWVPNPRAANGGWVSDPSHHLTPRAIAAANNEISALEHETGSEIGVAVVDSTSGLEMQEFATALHRAWGIGKKGANNGVLLLWDPVHRAVFISVGYGLEGAIPDRRAGRIRDDIMSQFRGGHFDDGILAGVRELAAAAREEAQSARTVTPADREAALRAHHRPGSGAGPQPRGLFQRLGWVLAPLVLVPTLLLGLFGWLRWRRFRPRTCSKGHPMRRLSETEDDAKLDQGEQLEEQLGSVNWDVWVCDTCGEVLRVPKRAWFSSYKDCPECKRRTLRETAKTIVAATTSHGGRELVSQLCRNCQYAKSFERQTPMLSSSNSGGSTSSGASSGGGGGGGSFGGGSAGGGGAGGRY